MNAKANKNNRSSRNATRRASSQLTPSSSTKDARVAPRLSRESRASGQLRIGISGWVYVPWRGTFYPKDVTQKRELDYASRKLNSIEINGTFYSLQRPESFQAWHDATPDDFLFSLKGGRFITHMKRLKNVEIPLANFFASGVLALKEKLGPILWQLPPNFAFDAERLESFFNLLPRTTRETAMFAKKHEPRMKGRTWLDVETDSPMRYALEVRHASFNDASFVTLCRKHRIAIVVADAANDWPVIDEATADFMYARLHGHEELYVSGYDESAIAMWAKRVSAWQQRGDVFVYFDNDAKVRSPFDAMNLAANLNGRAPLVLPEALKTAGEPARNQWPAVGAPRRATESTRKQGTKRSAARRTAEER